MHRPAQNAIAFTVNVYIQTSKLSIENFLNGCSMNSQRRDYCTSARISFLKDFIGREKIHNESLGSKTLLKLRDKR